MRTIMAKAFHGSPFPSKKNFQWILKKGGGGGGKIDQTTARVGEQEDEEEQEIILPFSTQLSSDDAILTVHPAATTAGAPAKKRVSVAAATETLVRLRSAVLTIIHNRRRNRANRLGSCVTGTIFGRRRGHVHLAFQVDTRSAPVLLVELATSTGGLVREMSSGLVRIALECERRKSANAGAGAGRLLDEPTWRAYCNGKKCGYAVRRECGPSDWKVLSAVEPVSAGAGVLPGDESDGNGEGDMMYMRAKFERVVGSKDSEAFYMMNPDGNGGPELSIYLLRV